MKKILAITAVFFVCGLLAAQETTMPKSPEAAFTQQLGLTEIQVAYARPLARGRKIFGELVPFDTLWRTGANDCTTIRFDKDIVFGAQAVKAGKYALFTIPNPTNWLIILNSDTTLHGNTGYDVQKDILRFGVTPQKSGRFYETFTIEINDLTPEGEGFLNLIWENTLVQIPLNKLNADLSKMEVIDEMPKLQTIETKSPTEELHKHSVIARPETDFKTQFAPVLTAYFDLKDALVGDNAKNAAQNAKDLTTALQAISTADWTDEERKIYEVYAQKLEKDAQFIGENGKKIETQRTRFDNLSSNMIALIKKLKINAETTYLQYCPMANDGKGASWLSKNKNVKNPYYGKSMLTCGSVKETIKS
jgi:Protein of unknown function (DUF2911)/Protein of unknown function (DUF3347)